MDYLFHWTHFEINQLNQVEHFIGLNYWNSMRRERDKILVNIGKEYTMLLMINNMVKNKL